jgi:hypothetical protein
MKKWTLLIAILVAATGIAFAGGWDDGKGGKAVRERGHHCYWSEPSTFSANVVVPNDQEDGGKETQVRYVCDNADFPLVRSRNFISDCQPDTWKADGRDKDYSLTRW